MKSTTIISILLAIFIFAGCANKARRENTISLSGAFALYPLVIRWSEEYRKINPEVRFNISAGGAGKGLADALAGAVDLGMFSRTITQVEIDRGTWWVGLTMDAVIPVISDQNPYFDRIRERGLTRDEFRGIFIDGTITNWGQLLTGEPGNDIRVFTRSDASGAAETWAQYMGSKQEDLLGVGIFGDPGLADAVIREPLSIGFNNTIFIYDLETRKVRPGIAVIPIDINENGKIDTEENFYGTFDEVLKAIASGIYPRPPARELYFVANGQPQKQATIDFIRWTLTEGQQFVTEAGYVPLDEEAVKLNLAKLD